MPPTPSLHGSAYIEDGDNHSNDSHAIPLLDTGKDSKPSPIGIPRTKPYVNSLDLVAFLISILCCVLAIISVGHEYTAWRLGVQNQLVVAGFLLSIMSLCLNRLTTFFFVLLEARFFRSTLQNFDGILLNGIFSPNLHSLWRFALLLSLAFPILMSVGYKQFITGSSQHVINATEWTSLPPYYGLFSVPQINTARGGNWPSSIYVNATLPFRIASALPVGNDSVYGPEPVILATFPVSYGSNTLVLSGQSTAMLDLPDSTRLQKLQNSIDIGDALNVTADARGTVAIARTDIPPSSDSNYTSACAQGGMQLSTDDMYNGFDAVILSASGLGNQSLFWLGWAPVADLLSSNTTEEVCAVLASYVKRYEISRRNCAAEWSVTRGGGSTSNPEKEAATSLGHWLTHAFVTACIELVDGSCSDIDLPEIEQSTFRNNTFFYPKVYLSLLEEAVGLFATTREGSPWTAICMTTFAASMAWSAFIALDGYGNQPNSTPGKSPGWSSANRTNQELGALYEVPNEVVYCVRQTLRKSIWLYLIFAAQPIIILIMLLSVTLMFSTPLDHGFGLVSILAGMRPESGLEVLQGASLSGELKKEIQLSIVPIHSKDSAQTFLEYRVGPVGNTPRNGRINKGKRYA